MYCDDATSSQDHSQETDVNADVEEFENEEKMKTPEQTDTSEPLNHEAMEVERKTRLYSSGGREDSLHLESDNGDLEDSNKHSQDQELGSGFVNEMGHQEDVAEIHRKDQDEETKHLVSSSFLSYNVFMHLNNSCIFILKCFELIMSFP